jgi:hypothetical protein
VSELGGGGGGGGRETWRYKIINYSILVSQKAHRYCAIGALGMTKLHDCALLGARLTKVQPSLPPMAVSQEAV